MRIALEELDSVTPGKNPLLTNPQFTTIYLGGQIFAQVISNPDTSLDTIVLHDKRTGKRMQLRLTFEEGLVMPPYMSPKGGERKADRPPPLPTIKFPPQNKEGVTMAVVPPSNPKPLSGVGPSSAVPSVLPLTSPPANPVVPSLSGMKIPSLKK